MERTEPIAPLGTFGTRTLGPANRTTRAAGPANRTTRTAGPANRATRAGSLPEERDGSPASRQGLDVEPQILPCFEASRQ